MGNDRLSLLCTAILNTIVARFTADAIDLPTRRYVHVGDIAVDCEQLVVAYNRVFPGFAGAEAPGALLPGTGGVRSVEVAVGLSRCVPTMTNTGRAAAFPDPADLNASGQALLVDAYVLVDALVNGHLAGAFDDACLTFSLLRAEPLQPSGGFGGNLVLIQAQI